jgi:hypothetical protein
MDSPGISAQRTDRNRRPWVMCLSLRIRRSELSPSKRAKRIIPRYSVCLLASRCSRLAARVSLRDRRYQPAFCDLQFSTSLNRPTRLLLPGSLSTAGADRSGSGPQAGNTVQAPGSANGRRLLSHGAQRRSSAWRRRSAAHSRVPRLARCRRRRTLPGCGATPTSGEDTARPDGG